MKVNISKFFTKGQRIKIEIDRHDTWSMDHTLAWIILPLLLQLKETKHGFPSMVSSQYDNVQPGQMCFDFMYEDSPEAYLEDLKKWDDILDKMIWSFKQIVEDEYDQVYHHGKSELTTKKIGNGSVEVVDLNSNGHWYDHVGHRLHEERIQEGLDLFAKYYRCLWD